MVWVLLAASALVPARASTYEGLSDLERQQADTRLESPGAAAGSTALPFGKQQQWATRAEFGGGGGFQRPSDSVL